MQIFKQEIIQDNTVITLEIQSLDASNAKRVSERLAEAMQGKAQIVLDLGELRYFDVNGFAAILKWVASRKGSDVRLCSQSGKIQALFELLSANALVPLFQTREEALESFDRPRRSEARRYAGTLATEEGRALSFRRTVLEPERKAFEEKPL